MAIGTTEVKVTGRLIFALRRGDEETSRSIDIPFPINDPDAEGLQDKINSANTLFTGAAMNTFVQPTTWRDNNLAEAQWTTTGVYYEITELSTTPITPETPVTLGSALEHHEQDEQQG